MAARNASTVGYTRVSLYALSTNEARLPARTASARAAEGSMSATTLRRGPSLCSKRNEWLRVNRARQRAVLGKEDNGAGTHFQGPSSLPNMMFW